MSKQDGKRYNPYVDSSESESEDDGARANVPFNSRKEGAIKTSNSSDDPGLGGNGRPGTKGPWDGKRGTSKLSITSESEDDEQSSSSVSARSRKEVEKEAVVNKSEEPAQLGPAKGQNMEASNNVFDDSRPSRDAGPLGQSRDSLPKEATRHLPMDIKEEFVSPVPSVSGKRDGLSLKERLRAKKQGEQMSRYPGNPSMFPASEPLKLQQNKSWTDGMLLHQAPSNKRLPVETEGSLISVIQPVAAIKGDSLSERLKAKKQQGLQTQPALNIPAMPVAEPLKVESILHGQKTEGKLELKPTSLKERLAEKKKLAQKPPSKCSDPSGAPQPTPVEAPGLLSPALSPPANSSKAERCLLPIPTPASRPSEVGTPERRISRPAEQPRASQDWRDINKVDQAAVKEAYQTIIMKELKSLQLQDFSPNLDWNTFLGRCQLKNSTFSRLQREINLKDSSPLQQLFISLQAFVTAMEKAFDDNICFPDNVVEVEIARSKMEAMSPLSNAMRTELDFTFVTYSEQYRRRNKEIYKKEHEAVTMILNRVRKHYVSGIENILGNSMYQQSEVDLIFQESYEHVKVCFLAACAFKNQHWLHHYTQEFEAKIAREKQNLWQRITENIKYRVNTELQALISATNLNYQEIIKTKRTEQMTEERFCEIHEEAVKETDRYFERELKSRNLHPEGNLLQNLKCQLNDSRGAAKKRDHDRTLFIYPQMAKVKKNASQTTGTTTSSGQDGACAGRYTPVQPPAPVSSQLLPEYMVFYIGFKKLVAGTFEGTTPKTCFTGDAYSIIENRVIIQSRYLPRKEERSFLGSFLLNKIDQNYQVEIDKRPQTFRLEDFVAVILRKLKIKEEAVKHGKYTRCVICVPQYLNHLQRSSINDGAKLAGFKAVDLISDTNAILLAHIQRNSGAVGNFVVANWAEPSKDVAWYTVDARRRVECDAVSGRNFIKKPWSFLGWLKSLIVTPDEQQQIFVPGDERWGRKHSFIIAGEQKGEAMDSLRDFIWRKFPGMDVKVPPHNDYPFVGAAHVAILRHEIAKKDYYTAKYTEFLESFLSHEKRDVLQNAYAEGEALSELAFTRRLVRADTLYRIK